MQHPFFLTDDDDYTDEHNLKEQETYMLLQDAGIPERPDTHPHNQEIAVTTNPGSGKEHTRAIF